VKVDWRKLDGGRTPKTHVVSWVPMYQMRSGWASRR
jgi:hypothetical protein